MSFLDLIFPKSCLECGKSGKYICEECLSKVRDGKVSRYSIALFRYEGVTRKAIIALKYKFAYEIAKELAEVCAKRVKEINLGSTKTILLPIPLHKMRQNWRGFNQVEEVGRALAESRGWQFMSNLLMRRVSGKPQVGLKGKDRYENIKDVFEANETREISKKGMVIVFDDVYTTGSTMREAIKTLKKSGFQRVFGLTISS